MTERTAGDRLAALEQARAQIEIALEADRDWAAFCQTPPGPNRLPHERALAGNPLFKSWLFLEQAIGDLKAKAARGDKGTSDDLTRIRGIDRALARRLAERGVTRYGQIAAWRADQVREVATALGLGRRISRENWIEQAALLELSRRAGPPDVAAAKPSGAPAVGGPPMEETRSQPPRVGLQEILEYIRSDAALRGDPLPAARTPQDEAPGSTAAPPAHVDLPAPSQPVTAPSLDATAEMSERDQEGRDDLQAVDSSPGSEAAGRGLPEPEEATVTFVSRERVHTEDEFSRDRNLVPGPADQAGAVGAADARHVPYGVAAEEAEVVIVSRPAGRSKPGRR